MDDLILSAFCDSSYSAARQLEERSRRVFQIVTAEGGPPPDRYMFTLNGLEYLVEDPDGQVHRSVEPVLFAVRFPEDYLATDDPATLGIRVVGCLAPVFHPNVRAPACCFGEAFVPGTPFEVLVRLCYDLVSYRLYCTEEARALNPGACKYIREHRDIIHNLRSMPLFARRFYSSATVSHR